MTLIYLVMYKLVMKSRLFSNPLLASNWHEEIANSIKPDRLP